MNVVHLYQQQAVQRLPDNNMKQLHLFLYVMMDFIIGRSIPWKSGGVKSRSVQDIRDLCVQNATFTYACPTEHETALKRFTVVKLSNRIRK